MKEDETITCLRSRWGWATIDQLIEVLGVAEMVGGKKEMNTVVSRRRVRRNRSWTYMQWTRPTMQLQLGGNDSHEVSVKEEGQRGHSERSCGVTQ